MKLSLIRRLVLLLCSSVFSFSQMHAADGIPLPSLLDDAMETLSRPDAPPVVLTGTIRNLTPELKSKIEITGSYVKLWSMQTPVVAKLAEDGAFRMEIPGGLPLRELWLTVKPFYYGQILLAHGLHIEIDAAKFAKLKTAQYVSPGVTFSGPDAELTRVANGFNAFEEKQRLECSKKAKAAADEKTGDFQKAKAKIMECRDLELVRLKSYAPASHQEFLENEIRAQYLAILIRAATNFRADLAGTPVWEEVLTHRYLGATNDQSSVFNLLGFYLISRAKRPGDGPFLARPEHYTVFIEGRLARPEFREQVAEFAPLVAEWKQGNRVPQDAQERQATLIRLRKAGLWDNGWVMYTQVREMGEQMALPPTMLDLTLLKNLPLQPAPANEIAERIKAEAGTRWTARVADAVIAANGASLKRAAEMIAQTAAPLVSGAAMGGVVENGRLECGAELFELPNQSPEQIIAWLRTKYPGKAFLIDLWGPWCAPCISAFPKNKETLKKLSAEPIIPVYLASQTEPVAWRQAVARFELAGINIRLGDTQAAQFLELFGTGGYPSYGMIDLKGQLIQNGSVGEWLSASAISEIAKAARGAQ